MPVMGLSEIEAEDLKKWDVLSSCQESFLADIRLVCLPVSKNPLVGAIWGLVATTSDKVYAVGDIPAWASDRETEGVSEPLEIAELSGRGVVGFACGQEHCLALTGSGDVFTWGSNSFGQLGRGSSESSRVPVEVPGLPRVTAVVCGFNFSLALTTEAVYEWGNRERNTRRVLKPRKVKFTTGVTPISIACGRDHAAAVGSDGKVYCWGNITSVQMGKSSAFEATSVYLPSAVSHVYCSYLCTMALTTDGQVWAWRNKNNFHEDLEVGLDDDTVTPPKLVKCLQRVTDITSVWYMKNFLARTDCTIFICGETYDDEVLEATPVSSLAEVLANSKTPSLSVRGRSGGPPAQQHTQTTQQQVQVVEQVTQQETEEDLQVTEVVKEVTQQETKEASQLTEVVKQLTQQQTQIALQVTKASQQQTQAVLELTKLVKQQTQQQTQGALQVTKAVEQLSQQLTKAVEQLSQQLTKAVEQLS